MKRVLLASGALLLVLAGYLAFWPVPIDPVAWEAPVDAGYVDPFGPDTRLALARGIKLGGHEGPECAAIGADGQVYATTLGGKILRISRSGRMSEFADAGGRALGIARHPDGALIVANAYKGLQQISRDGIVRPLLNEVNGEPLVAANSVTVAGDGTIYFTESSRKFGASEFAGSYKASLLDIMEHGGHGRVVQFDPVSGISRVLAEGIDYANGIAISVHDDYLLVAETGHYRILRLWLSGPRQGELEIVIANLPGFPDNITAGYHGRFWVGLAAPRNHLIDRISDKPWARKVVQRLPAWLRPQAVPSSHVFAMNGDGQVLMNLRDPNAGLPTLTGVLETGDALYLTTLLGDQLGRLDKRDLL